jgi:hypothetical protein
VLDAVPSVGVVTGAALAAASVSPSTTVVATGGDCVIVVTNQPAIATTAMLRPTTSPCDSRDGSS